MAHVHARLGSVTVLAALLAGCGPSVDDPANVARLGNWTVEMKLDAVSLNSMNISRSTIAEQGEGRQLIEKVESTNEQSCVEPKLHEEGDLLGAVDGALDDCTITDNSITGNSRHAVLACTLNGDPVEAVVDSTLEAESGHSRIRATVSKPKPTGGADRMSIIMNQTLTRTGDCG